MPDSAYLEMLVGVRKNSGPVRGMIQILSDLPNYCQFYCTGPNGVYWGQKSNKGYSWEIFADDGFEVVYPSKKMAQLLLDSSVIWIDYEVFKTPAQKLKEKSNRRRK